MTSPPSGPPRRGRRVLTGVAVVMAVVLAATGVGLVLVYRHLQGNLTTIDVTQALGTDRPVPQAPASPAPEQPVNILVMGSDTRVGQGSGYGKASVISGARSDTTLLVHLSGDRKRALVVSVPRDTWMRLPSCPQGNGTMSSPFDARFNAAFGIGGPACTIKAFEQLTGIRVDHFVVVDFNGFKNMVDALGGVPVCLPTAVDDPKSGLVLSAGEHVVTGQQALAFVRARETLGDGSDIGRIGRQQAFIGSLVEKAQSTSLLLNPARLYRVLDAATRSLTTDPQLGSLNALRKLAQSVAGISPDHVTFVTLPWAPRGDGATVVVNRSAAAPLIEAVRRDEPWPPPPDPNRLTTQPSRVRLTVVDATGRPGAAQRAVSGLRTQGFTVLGVTSAATAQPVTVRFGSGAGGAARTLAAAVPGAALASGGPPGTVVLELGSDYHGLTAVSVPTPTPTPSTRTAATDICR